MLRCSLAVLVALPVLCGCAPTGGAPGLAGGGFQAWPSPIEVRTYQGAFSRTPDLRKIELAGLAGEVVSAQVVVKSGVEIKGLTGKIPDLVTEEGRSIPAGAGRVRFGAYLPVDETMTMTADPLLEVERVDVPANVAQPLWLTLKIPGEASRGVYKGKLQVEASSGGGAVFDLELEVLPAVLPEPPSWSFYLNIWQDPSGVARAHKVKVWSEEHWALLEKYAANFAAHGMKSIMTSIVYDPWKSQSGYPFDTMVEWKYPGEFKQGGAGKFTWDFAAFDRYVDLMMRAGVREKIDCYALVMGPGGTTDANIRYLDTVAGEYRTTKLTVGEPLWCEAWTAFLPVLRAHLKEKGWFGKAVLGFDEKTERVMKVIFDFMIKTAPDFRLASSGGYTGDERKRGNEIVIYIDQLTRPEEWKKIEPLVQEMHADPNRYISLYTACAPYFPNTFLFSRLRESRLLPWMAWKYGFDGYTRWAVNAFPEDVWTQPNYKWHSGDMYFVYPGPDGPLDGMRWELMRQGIQDYEALRIAWDMAEKAGRSDLKDKLKAAVARGTILDSCRWIPYVAEARAMVNEVIKELAS